MYINKKLHTLSRFASLSAISKLSTFFDTPCRVPTRNELQNLIAEITKIRLICNKSVDILQQPVTTSLHQDALAWPATACDGKFVASCPPSCPKLIVKICYPQACCRLFQLVVTSLRQITSCNKPDVHVLVAT